MDSELDKRLARIEARQRALSNLLMSHIAASDTLVPGLAKETIDHAAIQRDSLTGSGHVEAAVILAATLDQLRGHIGLPPDLGEL